MHLTFKYDLAKDTDNFLRSGRAINSKVPTQLEAKYAAEFGELDVAKISGFLQAEDIDTAAKLVEIEAGWRPIEAALFERMDKFFDVAPPRPLTAYLSTNRRCTYSIMSDYFFVWMLRDHFNGPMAHEILHFYTWYSLHDELMAKGLTDLQYNDIKESLTEMLNVEFADLLGGYQDKGYPQHMEMRERIRTMLNEGKSVREVAFSLAP
jgi:hypothetical protein